MLIRTHFSPFDSRSSTTSIVAHMRILLSCSSNEIRKHFYLRALSLFKTLLLKQLRLNANFFLKLTQSNLALHRHVCFAVSNLTRDSCVWSVTRASRQTSHARKLVRSTLIRILLINFYCLESPSFSVSSLLALIWRSGNELSWNGLISCPKISDFKFNCACWNLKYMTNELLGTIILAMISTFLKADQNWTQLTFARSFNPWTVNDEDSSYEVG